MRHKCPSCGFEHSAAEEKIIFRDSNLAKEAMHRTVVLNALLQTILARVTIMEETVFQVATPEEELEKRLAALEAAVL